MGYQTIGLLAIGRIALGFSSGLAVNVGKLEPGPQRMRACSPGAAIEVAWGILRTRRLRLRSSWLVAEMLDGTGAVDLGSGTTTEALEKRSTLLCAHKQMFEQQYRLVLV